MNLFSTTIKMSNSCLILSDNDDGIVLNNETTAVDIESLHFAVYADDPNIDGKVFTMAEVLAGLSLLKA